jgi:hypothetical protein
VFVAITFLYLFSQNAQSHSMAIDAALNIETTLNQVNKLNSTKCSTGVDFQDCSSDQFEGVMRGFHGHLLFGTDPFYISHLPLYYPPHNYQAIYEVGFADDFRSNRLKKKLVKMLKESKGYATFEPARDPENHANDSRSFKIPEFTCQAKLEGNKIFYGNVHSGHFERESHELGFTGLIIKRVVYYKELSTEGNSDVDADPNTDADYIVFGHSGQYFASRVLKKRPGVDHIFPITRNSSFWLSEIGDLNHKVYQTKINGNQRIFNHLTTPQNIPHQDFYLESGELR